MYGLACPCRGCKAPELAARAVFDVLEQAWQHALGDLILKCRHLLTPESWAKVIGEMERGKHHVHFILLLKLQHWQELPWVLCILAHSSSEVARAGAAQILQKYDEVPEAVCHHRLTHAFCSEGSALRAQLEQFRDGTDLGFLGDLQRAVAQLRFIPVTERSVERPHSLVMRALSYKHHGPLSVTMAIRCNDILRDFATPASFNVLAAIAGEAKSTREIQHLLGIQNHPWLRALPRDASTHCRVRVLACVIYRCDDPSQFAVFQDAADSDKGSKKRTVKAQQEALGKSAEAPVP
eukprot:4325299-Alexandrium_andersonii.AAC.1